MKATRFWLQRMSLRNTQNMDSIINNYDRFVFVSPHLDDAILSCAQLIVDLKRKGKDITIITIFTNAVPDTKTPQARDFINKCGYKDPMRLFSDRIIEDKKVWKYIGARGIYLDFVDAAWREDQNKKTIYKNSSIQMSGVISPKDKKLVVKIESKLKKIIPKNKRVLVLGPCGIGGHADHVIVSKILEKLPYPKLFWEDFPYNTKHIKRLSFFIFNTKFHRLFSINNKSSEKERLIRFYKSQIKCLFPSEKIPPIKEEYYF